MSLTPVHPARATALQPKARHLTKPGQSLSPFSAAPRFGCDTDKMDKEAAQEATEGVKTLSVWETIKELGKQMNNPETGEVFKGLALQYGPDLALPALFSIPILGWGLGFLAMPFAALASSYGGKLTKEARDKLPNKENNPIAHAGQLGDIWKEYPAKEDTTKRLAETYNQLIKCLFNKKSPKMASLRKTLRIKPEGKAFSALNRLVNARQALHQKWYYKYGLRIMDWLHETIRIIPRSFTMALLLPKYAILAAFFALGMKPR